MTVLKIQNDYSFLKTSNEEVLKTLWGMLRFRKKDYFHDRRYKMKLWDGYIEFFRQADGRFLTGLLPEVQYALTALGVQYTVEDIRTTINWKHTVIDDQFLNQYLPKISHWPNGDPVKPITLHDYQVEFANQIIKHHRGVVYAPTGSGKTFMMMSAILCLPPDTITLVLVDSADLARQNYEAIAPWLPGKVGRIYGKYLDLNVITVMTVQSIHKIAKLLPKVKAIIVDEVHVMMSKRCLRVYRKLESACVRLGFSATPFKWDGSDSVQKFGMKGHFGPAFKVNVAGSKDGFIKAKTLQEREILSPSECTFFYVREPVLKYEIYQDAVTRGIAESMFLHNATVRLVNKIQGRTLILVERLVHGDYLANAIPGSLWIQGKDNEGSRKHVVQQLRRAEGNVVAIATQKIFSAGIDFFIHNFINCAGGDASHQIVQRMGRGLRKAGDKDILHYYDWMFMINKYLDRHSRNRVKVLQEEGHSVTIKEIDF